MDAPKQYEEVVESIKEILYPWRKLTIVTDGVDGAGKSALSRYVSWQLGVPVIETDLLLIRDSMPVEYHLECLKLQIDFRHSLNRPVLLEGIKILETLSKLNVEPDFLIFVESSERLGSDDLGDEIQDYFKRYKPREKANYIYTW
jgi:hypothetical protein